MKKYVSLLFFGSTTDSLHVLESLKSYTNSEFEINIAALITKPPSPIGRDKTVTATPVETWGHENNSTVLSFASDPNSPWKYLDETTVIESLSTFKADLLVSASYGQIIPWKTIQDTTFGGINVHPSLLPRWRGADPLPWTILSGDHQTGVSLVTLSKQFDEGKILRQKKIPILDTDTAGPLRETLFKEGSVLLGATLQDYLKGNVKGELQKPEFVTTARRITRDDGFIPWDLVKKAITGQSVEITELPPYLSLLATRYGMAITPWATVLDRMFRALLPWPGVWSQIEINGEKKRLKLLAGHSEKHEEKELFVPDTVQLEGKQSVPFQQFKSAYSL